MFKKLHLLILISLFSNFVFAQKGTIRGKVIDKETGETLPFANVYVESNTSLGTTTDLDGLYSLKLNAGEYTLVYSFVSYEDIKKQIIIKDGSVQVIDVALSMGGQNLEAIEVIVEVGKANTIAAFDIEKMKSINLVDGTSQEQMKKTGDNDAGEVMKRVTGVSVEGGKHVYVRGLGDRYTKTILNGMEIPGLDPDRNNVQMDIFPTQLIDNIVVYKTFSPDLVGDFTGGMVDIQTRDFPSVKNISASLGYGYNSVTTFNKDFILYKGSSTDWLGFDNGKRDLPINENLKVPDPVLYDQDLTNITAKFPNQMGVENSNNFLNQNYSFAIGNQANFDSINIDYGYNFVFTYRNNYNYFKRTEFNEYLKDSDLSVNDLERHRTSVGPMGVHDVMWSALLGQSIKYKRRHKISFNVFHTQNGTSKAARLVQKNYEINPATLINENLQYTERSITNVSLIGKHNFFNNLDVNWKISPTISKIKDPDIRSTALELNKDNDSLYLNQSVGSEIRRIYRNLSERNLSFRLDFSYNTKQWNSLDTKIKFGFLNTYKERDFSVLDYLFLLRNINGFQDDPNQFLQQENLWTPQTGTGTYVRGEREMANTFFATQNIMGAYAMNELPINKKLKSIYGLRIEKVLNTYTGQNNFGTERYLNQTVLDEINFLPSLNIVYTLKDTLQTTSNLRASFSQTVARPSFREKSIAQIYDPIQGRRYSGNINLLQTDIKNYDLRYELFFGRTETISLSGFYKDFTNPIELASYDLAPSEIVPVNADKASLYGVELELRKRIGFIEKDWNKLYIGSNFTYVNSKVDMTKVIVSKGTNKVSQYELRKAAARENETVSKFRPMAGQSPYILNAYVSYDHDSLGIGVNVSYNVQGKRLSIVGVGSLPDVYEMPFHSLNLKVSKKLGKFDQWLLSARAENLLGWSKYRVYDSYNADEIVYDLWYEGRTYSVSLSYSFRPKDHVNY